jgi:hypothetical protein
MRAFFFMTAASLMMACLLSPADAQQSGGKSKAKVSAEMRDFMKSLDGNGKHVDEALKKYAAKDVDTSDMSSIGVRDPKITNTETKDKMTCYTMSCKSGILDRVYLICWKDKKIQKLQQLSLK